MLCVFWDIDGTLLTTARAGIFAWEEATEEGRAMTLEEAVGYALESGTAL